MPGGNVDVIVGECVTDGLVLGVKVNVGVTDCVPGGRVCVVVGVGVTVGLASGPSGWKGVGEPGSGLVWSACPRW